MRPGFTLVPLAARRSFVAIAVRYSLATAAGVAAAVAIAAVAACRNPGSTSPGDGSSGPTGTLDNDLRRVS